MIVNIVIRGVAVEEGKRLAQHLARFADAMASSKVGVRVEEGKEIVVILLGGGTKTLDELVIFSRGWVKGARLANCALLFQIVKAGRMGEDLVPVAGRDRKLDSAED
jgi:hypothetical protein